MPLHGLSSKLLEGFWNMESIGLVEKNDVYTKEEVDVKESSSSTMVRIVFNASAKDPNGNSLNDCLLKGPNLLPDIAAVLLRFRMHKFALNGDLRKMFCQTAVIPDHQRYQLYL